MSYEAVVGLIKKRCYPLTEIHKTTVVPYSAEEMYALVFDIESYPDFLPWCSGSQLLVHNTYHSTGTVSLEAGMIKQSFTTENTMKPGRSIEMKLVKGPFKHLNGSWYFEPVDDKSCTISFNISFEFKNKLVKLALGKIFNRIMDSLVASFIQRAGEVYGQR